MKVNIIKASEAYPLGVTEVDAGRGNYLIRTGQAEKVEAKATKEKVEVKKTTEKVNRKK